MPTRALLALATCVIATACISTSTPAVDYGTGSRFVPFVVDSIDDMGQGDAVALTSDNVPYVSYFGFPEQLEEGQIATPRPFGSPTVPGVMLATANTEGLWQRGGVQMEEPAANLKPNGVAVPFGPVEVDDLDLDAQNTNGTALTLEGDGTVHMAWAAANRIDYATTKLGGTATVTTVFELSQTGQEAGPLGRPSIALDDSGAAWVAFGVETAKGIEIHVATQRGETWSDQVATTFPSCAGCPAPQPTGIGAVGGKLTVVYADPAAKQIRAATLNGSRWSDSVVANGSIGFGLSFAAVGDAAYVASYTGSGQVDESTWSSGAWTSQQVSTVEDPDVTATGHEASNTAIAATGDGTVYVSWETGDGVQLASGTDSFTPVDVGTLLNTGSDPALATSDSGVALGWYDETAQNQMIGFLGDLTEVVVARPSPSLTVSAAPGGGGACGGKKVALDEVAQGIAFQQTCLVAPADEPFTINFDNQDAGQQHNIAIFTDDTATDNVFRGDLITGVDQTTYDVPAQDAGSYYFHCDVHPNMTGTLAVVKGAK
jgi:plastocyanin